MIVISKQRTGKKIKHNTFVLAGMYVTNRSLAKCLFQSVTTTIYIQEPVEAVRICLLESLLGTIHCKMEQLEGTKQNI